MAHSTTLDTWINDTSERRRASPDLKRLAFGPLLFVGIAALALMAFISRSDSESWSRFWHAYLIGCTYCASISLGALFFVVVQHLTGARWGVVLRRIGEILSMGIGVCGLFFVAILFNILSQDGSLYPWASTTGDIALKNLAEPKQVWLNPPFFIGRQVFYFALWFFIARYFYNRSVAQDRAADNEPMAPLRWWSGPAMLLFALSINFASMDWLMTLNPTWFSTIFGVYYFAGCAVAVFALLAVLIWFMQSRDILTHTITEEHRHDVGKLLFGFVLFWGYIAFSQFLLIWYAAIPEEVQWYAVRQIEPSMTGISRATALLFIFHFCIPFLGIMSRFVRRQKGLLAGWGVYMLVMHWFDLYYIIAPQDELNNWSLSGSAIVVYVGTTIGLVCLYAAAILYIAAGNWLVPVRDPRLADSLAFENI